MVTLWVKLGTLWALFLTQRHRLDRITHGSHAVLLTPNPTYSNIKSAETRVQHRPWSLGPLR
jgi:hypothetical protein